MSPAPTQATHSPIVIIGNGFSGLGAAVRLKQRGIEDFLILEKAEDVGGTWRDNTYPGCACDVPATLYSFSFAPNPDWDYLFARGPEIHRYLQEVSKQYGLDAYTHSGHEVLGMEWDEKQQIWHIETSKAQFTADFVIASSSPLHDPNIPDIKGLDTFKGHSFHSATWDHDFDVTGKRIAVVGTGASAIQFVPEIRKQAEHVVVFQRTPSWVAPRMDFRFSPRMQWMFRRLPITQKALRSVIYAAQEVGVVGFRNPWIMRIAERVLRSYIKREVPDPELRAKLTPSFTLGCKRIMLHGGYYPAMCESNVELVTSAITEVTENAVIDADGNRHEVDAIVFGTGFHATDSPIGDLVKGVGGRKLDDLWQGSPKAHLGISVSGFPNLVLLLGPNTGLGHNSVVLMIEAQVKRAVTMIEYLRSHRLATIDVSEEELNAFADRMDADLDKTVWNAGGCKSWYRDETGRISALWPFSTLRYRFMMSRFEPTTYEFQGRRPRVSEQDRVAG